MSQDLGKTLSIPSKENAIKSNLITTISDDMNKGYGALKNTISGGGNKKDHIGTKSSAILSGGQITTQGEKRGEEWRERRK